ncbi:RebB family R body protein [Agarilytica rhodophyticola]|uniref:RebB family R body protein n=1 Tax=Agarilytica rhodophyticola TaxID=1737490 RepID=UPI000B349C31|nr:RebB family R body protein [Agarilytica rhodophyticola]
MPVNEQVTDSVTQVNSKVVGETPAMTMGNIILSSGQALSTSALNVASGLNHGSITMQAATIQGINSLVATGTSVLGRVSEEVVEKG